MNLQLSISSAKINHVQKPYKILCIQTYRKRFRCKQRIWLEFEAQMNLIKSLTVKVAKFLHTKFENQKLITIYLLKKYLTTDKWVKNGLFYSSTIWLMAISLISFLLIFDGMLDLYKTTTNLFYVKQLLLKYYSKIQSLK